MIQNPPSFVMFPFLLILYTAASHTWQFTVAHMLQHEISVLKQWHTSARNVSWPSSICPDICYDDTSIIH